MAFNGLSFIFDGIASERFGLYIYSINGNGNESSQGGTKLSLHTDRTSINTKFNLLGVSEDSPLVFNLTFGSFKPLSRHDISVIQKWLFCKHEYKQLEIVQSDMAGLHYNCILSDSEIINVSNMSYAFKCTVTCDSQFAWEKEKTYTYTIPSNNRIVSHYNDSDEAEYVRPIVEFTSTTNDNAISIINESNNNWTTTMKNLTTNEKIIINCETEEIISSVKSNPLADFNGGWLELGQGLNRLRIDGNLSQIKFTYANARRIGG